jgi:CrcB protein
MTTIVPWLGAGLIGALGAYARFVVGGAVAARFTGTFPLGTFVVNITGGFLLGLLTGLAVRGDAHLVLATGFLGAFTTFSTWMVEAQRLAEDGDWPMMWLCLVGSMLAGLAATGAGWLLGAAIS